MIQNTISVVINDIVQTLWIPYNTFNYILCFHYLNFNITTNRENNNIADQFMNS